MYGVIFDFLRDYVIERHGGERTWKALLEGIGQSVHKIYFPIAEYSDEEIVALAQTAAGALNLPLPLVLEDFGTFVGHKLVTFYHMYVKNQDWRTFDIIEHADNSIHDAIHRHNVRRTPPKIRALRRNDNELILFYQSKRRLCQVAKGIILGLGEHFGESFDIYEKQCQSRGARECEFHVKRVGLMLLDDDIRYQPQSGPDPSALSGMAAQKNKKKLA